MRNAVFVCSESGMYLWLLPHDENGRRCTTTSVVGSHGTWEKLHDFLRARRESEAGRRWNKRVGNRYDWQWRLQVLLSQLGLTVRKQIKGQSAILWSTWDCCWVCVCLASRSQAGNKIDVAVGKPISGPDCSGWTVAIGEQPSNEWVQQTALLILQHVLRCPWAEGLFGTTSPLGEAV